MKDVANTWNELLQHVKSVRGELGLPDQLWFRAMERRGDFPPQSDGAK